MKIIFCLFFLMLLVLQPQNKSMLSVGTTLFLLEAKDDDSTTIILKINSFHLYDFSNGTKLRHKLKRKGLYEVKMKGLQKS